jgi:hypothetical protein
MRWIEGLKIWNARKGGAWCVPRRGTPEHAEVKAIMAEGKESRQKAEIEEEFRAAPPKKVKPRISEKVKAVMEERKVESKKEKVKAFLKRAVEKYKAKKAVKVEEPEEDLEQLARELEQFTAEAKKPAKEKKAKKFDFIFNQKTKPPTVDRKKLYTYFVAKGYDVQYIPIVQKVSDDPPTFETVYYQVKDSEWPFETPIRKSMLKREFTLNKSTGSYDAAASRGAVKGKLMDRLIPHTPSGDEKDWLDGKGMKQRKE